MTDLSDEFFDATLASIQERLTDLITQPKSDSDPPEKWSKSFIALLKAEEEARSRLDRRNAQDFAAKHTRYEDMPPPTPEDEARFYERFRKLVGLVNDPDADARAMVLAERLEQGVGLRGLANMED